MENFLSKTSIHGVEFFSSKSKIIHRCGFFVFFIAFCGLGFYMHGIYLKWLIEPMLGEEVNLIPLREVPFPAVTICNSIFTRDQKPNLYQVLKSDPEKLKLSIDEQNHLAANVQACAPHLSEKILKFCQGRNESLILDTLREKFHHINDSFPVAGFRVKYHDCSVMFNHVLTDYGFCFSFNLLNFNQIFNDREISDDFKSYEGAKFLKDFSGWNFTFEEIKKEEKSHWELEKGYLKDTNDTHPIRSVRANTLHVVAKYNDSDLNSNNFCPELGKSFQIFLHMPNEILTPFHKPENLLIREKKFIVFIPRVYKTDESLRIYSPKARGCYFEGEKKLKFFKSYTKLNCEFECLANETLKACGCVKFSMPRNNSTKVCGLDKTKCYVDVKKKWSKISRGCKCLQSCTFIDYRINENSGTFDNPSTVARNTYRAE